MDASKAFDRLERSGGGTIVPLLIFCLGMVITLVACLAIRNLDKQIEDRIRQREQALRADEVVDLMKSGSHVLV